MDLEWFTLVEGLRTPLAFVTVDGDGEPTFRIHGEGIEPTLTAVGDRLLDAVQEAGAFCFGSNTMVGQAEVELTLAARERALELGRPVVFDPNLRLGRWDSPARAGTVTRECVRDAFLVKCNEQEARLITGEDDARAAADSMVAGGARHAIVTLGERGAILRGPGVSRVVAARPARVLNTTGAGDAFLGVVLAALSKTELLPAGAGRRAAPGRGGGHPRLRAMGRAGVSAGRAAWAPPARARVGRLRRRLAEVYGVPVQPPHGDGVAELVLTVLSQSTNDRNRDVAFLRLRERWMSWEAVRDVPVEEVEEAIRPGGISKVKSARIQAILCAIGDPLDLSWMRTRRSRRRRPRCAPCPAWGARPPRACCCSPTAAATCRSTPTSAASARGWGSCARARAPRSPTTRWSRSRRPAPSSSCTSTCCATAAARATRSGRRARTARCGGCARAGTNLRPDRHERVVFCVRSGRTLQGWAGSIPNRRTNPAHPPGRSPSGTATGRSRCWPNVSTGLSAPVS